MVKNGFRAFAHRIDRRETWEIVLPTRRETSPHCPRARLQGPGQRRRRQPRDVNVVLPNQLARPTYYGRDARSMAFLRPPGTDLLYSGVTNKMASGAEPVSSAQRFLTGADSASSLKTGIPSRSNASRTTPSGVKTWSAGIAARLLRFLAQAPGDSRNFDWIYLRLSSGGWLPSSGRGRFQQ